jgi:hypothetical protein
VKVENPTMPIATASTEKNLFFNDICVPLEIWSKR